MGESVRRSAWALAAMMGIAALATAPGCKRRASGNAAQGATEGRRGEGETPPAVPFEVCAESTELTFFWFDERGNAHGVSRMEEVPPAQRATVRVEPSDPEQRTPGWVFVADLRAAGPDGRFVVRVVPSEQLATELAARTGLAQAMAAPPPSAPSAAPAGTAAILAPSAPNNGQARVVLYGAEWCSACHQAANWLRANNIPFIERDIEREPQAQQEMIARARAQGVPTGSIPLIEVGGRMLVGFSPEAIQQALRGG
jgi:arsenate reductase-like glutaredoxin family protein